MMKKKEVAREDKISVWLMKETQKAEDTRVLFFFCRRILIETGKTQDKQCLLEYDNAKLD